LALFVFSSCSPKLEAIYTIIGSNKSKLMQIKVKIVNDDRSRMLLRRMLTLAKRLAWK